MRRPLLGLLTAALIATGLSLAATPAQAAGKPVTIKKVSTHWVGWSGTATVKPAVKKAKKVKVLKATVTVQQGKRTVARNKKSATLKVGTYRVTTKVTYRFKGKKRTTAAKHRIFVKQGRCATKANYQAIRVSMTAGSGDAVATVAKKVRSSGELASEVLGQMTLTQWRDLLADEDPEAARAFDALIALYGADAVMDIGSYGICRNTTKTVDVLYIDGRAIDKSVEPVA